MTRLKFLLIAKTQYNIQSPFLFELYSEVISPTLDKDSLQRLNIAKSDRIAQLLYKLQDHYNTQPILCHSDGTSADVPGTQAALPAGERIFLFPYPHNDKASEQAWQSLHSQPSITLSVDLFYAGIAFTSNKLSKQHFLLR